MPPNENNLWCSLPKKKRAGAVVNDKGALECLF